jgi:signal transduction histidine kinase/ActR/RegA family two-component response regulator
MSRVVTPSIAGISQRLLFLVLLPLLLVSLLAAALAAQMFQLLSAARRVDRTNGVIAEANHLLGLVTREGSGIRGYVVTREPEFLETYRSADRELTALLPRLERLVADDPQQVRRLRRIGTEEAAWERFSLTRPARRAGARDPRFLGPMHEETRLLRGLRAHVDGFIAVETAQRDRRTAEMRATTWGVLGAGGTLCLLFAAVISLATYRGVTQISRSYETMLGERDRGARNLLAANQRLAETLSDLQAAQSRMIEQERLRALGQMASGIAHDFNNALMPVVGFSDLLLEIPAKRENPETLREYLEAINTAARDAASIVERLRELYRPRGADEPPGPVDLPALVDQSALLTQPKWKDQAQQLGRKIELRRELQPGPPVAGYEPELREALTNLIFNAVDALPEGGTITIAIHPTEAGGSELSVSDTGTGMPEEVRQRCLDPFFSTKGEHGTGLGLAMVQGIMLRHGGSLKVESEPGRGTTIRLFFPPAAALDSVPVTAPACSPPPLRILVVDDEERARSVTLAYLAAEGHSVVSATGGEEGLAAYHAGDFDLVVTDRAMPGMSGDQLALAIRQLSSQQPILMLTGFGTLMAATDDIPPGVDMVLGKPPTLLALRAAVARVSGESTLAPIEPETSSTACGAVPP